MPVEYVGGDPRLAFYKNGEMVKEVNIADFDVNRIKEVLHEHGFIEKWF